MSIESGSNKLPEEALIAFLDGIRTELSSPSDPAILTQVRSIFRKHIPLHLRSYAAALLILRAAGISSGQAYKASVKAKPAEKLERLDRIEKTEKPQASRKQAAAGTTPKPKQEGMIPLFVSMGKRQRLRPQELRTLIGEKANLAPEELGRVHLFDNYSFIDVPEIQAEKIVAACEGMMLKNRTLEIKPAKKRNEVSKDIEG